jgi:DNA adenine methylase
MVCWASWIYGYIGNKYFGGVARNKTKGIQDYYQDSINALLKQVPNLIGINFKNCSFKDIKSTISGYVIYCDPPYRDTTKYVTEKFPYDEFYDWCREMSKNNIVLVSEYNMPSDFECIWSKEVNVGLDSNGVWR